MRSNSPEIIYEDSEILVCHKPAGIPTQSSRIGTKDMVSILKTYLAQPHNLKAEPSAQQRASNPSAASGSARRRQPQTARKEPYLALIHRLDQPVEGLLVFAKTPAAAKNLNQQLTTSGFGKFYRAVVHGIPSEPEADLEDYLIKDARANVSRVCSKDTLGAKLARLHYKVTRTELTASGETLSHLIIHLDTGRHHQIRVQMSHAGCPLVGDRKYNVHPTETAYSQLMLCAYRLEFKHPSTGKFLCFELPEVV